jgi:hypothetical protein
MTVHIFPGADVGRNIGTLLQAMGFMKDGCIRAFYTLCINSLNLIDFQLH